MAQATRWNQRWSVLKVARQPVKVDNDCMACPRGRNANGTRSVVRQSAMFLILE